MSQAQQRVALDLQRQAVFTLPDAHGVDIECESGTLWITIDHDRRDVVLKPGQHFRSDAHRRALIEAMEPSCVRLGGRRLAFSPMPEAQPRPRSPWRLRFPSQRLAPA